MARVFTWTVVVYDTLSDFPATGDVDVIYIDASTNKPYRYDDSYYKISSAEVNVWGALGSVSKGGGGGGGASWGNITGTLSSQTDLQTALDAKQNTLTLTTTGTSGAATLVGSTLNIPQYSGGVGGGIHAFLKPSTGRVVSYNIASTGITGANYTVNRLSLIPFVPINTFDISSMVMFSNIAVAGSLCRLLIYSDNNGLPNSKLYESADLNLSTTGIKTATTTFTFNAGTTYWLAFHGSATTSNVTHIQTQALATIANSGASVSFGTIYFVSVALGSAPSTITSPTLQAGSMPWIGLIQA